MSGWVAMSLSICNKRRHNSPIALHYENALHFTAAAHKKLIGPKLIAYFFAACGIACLLSWAMVRGWFPSPIDTPGERSLHAKPIPRAGGLAIFAAAIPTLIYAPLAWTLVLAIGLVFAVSLFDDFRGLPASYRLFVQSISAGLALYSIAPSLSTGGIILAFLAIIWATNLFNFMDGSDGLAGLTGAIGLIGLTVAALTSPSAAATPISEAIATFCLALAGGCIGFLAFNWPPAKLFMGDCGAITLGFCIAVLSILGWQALLWPAWFPILIFFPFIADATLTLALRAARGERLFKAHREHVYQKLVLLGLGKGPVLAIYGTAAAVCTGLALAALRGSITPLLAFILASLPLAMLYISTQRVWARAADRVFRLNPQMVTAYAFDVCAAGIAWLLAFMLRVSFSWTEFQSSTAWPTLPLVLGVEAMAFFAFGLYRGRWRFASMTDFQRIAAAVLVGAAAIPVLTYLLRLDAPIPRSVLLAHPLLTLVLMAGGRFAYRSYREHHMYTLNAARGEPVIVLGAGDQAAAVVRALGSGQQWRVVALLDDNPKLHGISVYDVPVAGDLSKVTELAKMYSATHAVIAMPNEGHQTRRRAATLAASAGLRTLTVPSYHDLMAGVAPSALRAIELDDLLGRDPVRLDDQKLGEWLGGKAVVVTGAGGSIGTELCHQIGRFFPSKIIAIDVSEHALYVLTEALRGWFPSLVVVPIVADVKQQSRMTRLFNEHRPVAVFHAAAYKHVPLMETDNAWEALTNNALGTHIVAEAALAAGVESFVLISTDKAVNPASIMGVSKRLAELVVQGVKGQGTRFVAVRFGNVLGSAGSVIPKFREQIARGGPITITHPEMTRYFMSIQEASQLVMQAGLIGEDGQILVMDMGEPVKIVDLARDLIRLSGKDEALIKVEFTGLRPGEKLQEAWMADFERLRETSHSQLRALESAPQVPTTPMIDWLKHDEPPANVRQALKKWVPEYTG
jgi:FlaA1/EpsC-like NDP-sugar epimerase/UDP-N-acetylmuramyl pentapeptide phosphotransferase/UDP-N-acetylglucosamine-1-phosphate transferase